MTVEENILFPLRIKKVKNAKIRLERITTLFKISHLLKRYPQKLSGGEQQRVALARTLIADFELILLDEPFSALDAARRRELHLEVMKLHRQLKFTLVFVTHDLDEAETMASNVLLLNQGKVIQHGPPSQVFSAPATPWAAHFFLYENIVKLSLLKLSMSPEPLNPDRNHSVKKDTKSPVTKNKVVCFKAKDTKVSGRGSHNQGPEESLVFEGISGEIFHYGGRKVMEVFAENNRSVKLLGVVGNEEISPGEQVMVTVHQKKIVLV
jgi:ABC-type Fe3+/spermidine/putrescine transport system ATPase subunit